MKKKKIQVLFCASEVAPFEKTGGLADVAGSLPVALAKHGAEVLILMPRYRNVKMTMKKICEGVEAFFIPNDEYFDRPGLYGNDKGDYPDNLQRFSYFCHEALHYAQNRGFQPDILHAHDWQTALLPALLKTRFRKNEFFAKTRSIFTIHNIAYQGIFPHRQYNQLGLDPALYADTFEFYGKVNLMKAGLLFADHITTVSPTYSHEIKTKEYGFGLDGVIKKRQKVLKGILNGIDVEMWDPAKDTKIAQNYDVSDREGKKACKAGLQKQCGFEVNEEVPLFGMVTRLAEQKGLELVTEMANTFLKKEAQFVILGDGDPVYRTAFKNIVARHPKNAAAFIGFDTEKAHSIYSASDFFLMPSYFEPCGLGQMIAMRYGSLPIVRRVGGLADTVIDAVLHPERGNGFVFVEKSPEKLMTAVNHALGIFKDKARLATVRKTAMKADFSWDRSAEEYVKLYMEALKS